MDQLLVEDLRVLVCSGRDARSFLHSQLATDLRKLAVGQALHAALLAANGRVLAAGSLYLDHEERFLWVLDGGLAQLSCEHLRRFVLRSKLHLAVDESLRVAHGAASTVESALSWRDAAGRTLRLIDAGSTAAAGSSAAGWTLAAIEAGLVDFRLGLRDRFLAQALGLHLHGAIALNKGCYPGQEIVARTHYLGRVKRGLARFRCAHAPTSVAVLDAQGRSCGEILSVQLQDQMSIGLATLETSAEEARVLTGNGIAVLELDFPGVAESA